MHASACCVCVRVFEGPQHAAEQPTLPHQALPDPPPPASPARFCLCCPSLPTLSSPSCTATSCHLLHPRRCCALTRLPLPSHMPATAPSCLRLCAADTSTLKLTHSAALWGDRQGCAIQGIRQAGAGGGRLGGQGHEWGGGGGGPRVWRVSGWVGGPAWGKTSDRPERHKRGAGGGHKGEVAAAGGAERTAV